MWKEQPNEYEAGTASMHVGRFRETGTTSLHWADVDFEPVRVHFQRNLGFARLCNLQLDH
jgi:hypothetical protein